MGLGIRGKFARLFSKKFLAGVDYGESSRPGSRLLTAGANYLSSTFSDSEYVFRHGGFALCPLPSHYLPLVPFHHNLSQLCYRGSRPG